MNDKISMNKQIWMALLMMLTQLSLNLWNSEFQNGYNSSGNPPHNGLHQKDLSFHQKEKFLKNFPKNSLPLKNPRPISPVDNSDVITGASILFSVFIQNAQKNSSPLNLEFQIWNFRKKLSLNFRQRWIPNQHPQLKWSSHWSCVWTFAQNSVQKMWN